MTFDRGSRTRVWKSVCVRALQRGSLVGSLKLASLCLVRCLVETEVNLGEKLSLWESFDLVLKLFASQVPLKLLRKAPFKPLLKSPTLIGLFQSGKMLPPQLNLVLEIEFASPSRTTTTPWAVMNLEYPAISSWNSRCSWARSSTPGTPWPAWRSTTTSWRSWRGPTTPSPTESPNLDTKSST